ncbi:MAG: hypothetical protein ACK55A_20110, partial [Gemmatimonas sp.]
MTLPHDALPPRPPVTAADWQDRGSAFLRFLSTQGVPAADAFVREDGKLPYRDVHRFFGAINPDPTLGGRDLAAQQRRDLGLPAEPIPNSLADALAEIRALDEQHVSRALAALATYVQESLHF